MRLLYERFGKTRERYAPEALPSAITDATGIDGSQFIRRYVTGNETLPVKQCLETAGYAAYTKSYSGEVYLVRMKNLGAEQARIHRALTERR
jgi:predicted metalloprotease with PDZ domain